MSGDKLFYPFSLPEEKDQQKEEEKRAGEVEIVLSEERRKVAEYVFKERSKCSCNKSGNH